MAFDHTPPGAPAAPPPATADASPDPFAALREADRQLRGRFAHLWGGQSPWAASQAWEDWAFHLATAPGHQAALWGRALDAAMALALEPPGGVDQGRWAFQPLPADRRFRDPAWTRPPFHLLAQAQLAAEAQWRAATSGVRGVDDHHARRVEFLGRFALNALAPVNFPWTNPQVIEATWRSGGLNLVEGAQLYLDDLARLARGEKLMGLEQFKLGETVAVTPGEVIFQNGLMEVIQYAPMTPTARPEPILIVPAWVMKYYILDLTPAESLVRHLVAQGFTVFIISWKNPGAELNEISFEDYRRDGVAAAMDVVARVVPGEKVHAVGYCLGGTVLAIAAAAWGRDEEDRLASLSLFAAQTDFETAGELMLFIDESQLSLLEDMMRVRGYLDARQMAGVFYALRANELLYSRLVERYQLAQPRTPAALEAWLADPTRMPARMHSEYLRELFLDDSFAHGGYQVDGRAVAIKDIRAPTFSLGAERDHIAPWRSVYKLELYGLADTTFVLTGGGHNTSVVSPPGKAGAYYYVDGADDAASYVDPDSWLGKAERREGSWWPEWLGWLDRRGSRRRVAPPPTGLPGADPASLRPAPGLYVFEP